MFRETLEAYRERFPADHYRVAQTESLLGTCLTRAGRFEEAEPLLVHAYPRLKDQIGERALLLAPD